jgi:uncharacterized protein (TIGR02145 family)
MTPIKFLTDEKFNLQTKKFHLNARVINSSLFTAPLCWIQKGLCYSPAHYPSIRISRSNSRKCCQNDLSIIPVQILIPKKKIMKLNKLKAGALLCSILLLAGCGGGGGSSNPSISDDSGNSDATTKTGLFIDAPVTGLSYQTSSGLQGVLQQGKFTYQVGDQITFKLGDLTLTTQEAAELISVLQDENGTNISAMLIALDEDGNPENGIVIKEETVNLFRQNVSFVSSEIAADSPDFQATFKLLTGKDIPPEHIAANHAEGALKQQLLKSLDSPLYDAYIGSMGLDILLSKYGGLKDNAQAKAQDELLSNLTKRIDLFAYQHVVRTDIDLQMAIFKNKLSSIKDDHAIIKDATGKTATIFAAFYAANKNLSNAQGLEEISVAALKTEVDVVKEYITGKALDDAEVKIPVFGALAKRFSSMATSCIPDKKDNRLLLISECTAAITTEAVNTINDSVAAVRYGLAVEKNNRLLVLDELLARYFELGGNWSWIDEYYGFDSSSHDTEYGKLYSLIFKIADKTLPNEVDFDINDAIAVKKMFNSAVKEAQAYSDSLIKNFNLNNGYDPTKSIVTAGSVVQTQLAYDDGGKLAACFTVKNNLGRIISANYQYTIDGDAKNEGQYTLGSYQQQEYCHTLNPQADGEEIEAITLSVNLQVDGQNIETFNFSKIALREYEKIADDIVYTLNAQTPLIISLDHWLNDDDQGNRYLHISAATTDANGERALNFDDNFQAVFQQISGKEALDLIAQDIYSATYRITGNDQLCAVFKYTITHPVSGLSDSQTLALNNIDEEQSCSDTSPISGVFTYPYIEITQGEAATILPNVNDLKLGTGEVSYAFQSNNLTGITINALNGEINIGTNVIASNYSLGVVVTSTHGGELVTTVAFNVKPRTVNNPATPTNLVATSGNGQISLNWTSSEGQHRVHYATESFASVDSVDNYGVLAGYNNTSVNLTNQTITGLTNGTKYYFVVTALKDGKESSPSNEVSATPVAPTETITHNGFSYKPVTSPNTGRIWLDRNLGANQACETYDDTECFGDYYQWGRGTDGHEKSNSSITEVQADDVTSVGHGNFIVDKNFNYHGDWARSIDNEGDIRQKKWNPCPAGYEVPIINELLAENINNRYDAYHKLKLPSAGYRSSSNGQMNPTGSYGSIWSNSLYPFYGNSSAFFLHNDAASNTSHDRAYGHPVRCIKAIIPSPDAKISTRPSGRVGTYKFKIFNYQNYPSNLFQEKLDDGLNRFQVVIHDQHDTHIYGYSSLTSINILISGDLWFLIRESDTSTIGVKIKIFDRKDNKYYSSVFLPLGSASISHNNLTYQTVVSPSTGRVWLDRNLGANRVCQRLDDEQCYGHYYQWGRLSDGHELPSSLITSTKAASLINAGDKFICDPLLMNDGEWLESKDIDLRMSYWENSDGTSVCPKGFKVPSVDDIELEIKSYINNVGLYSSFLKLPSSTLSYRWGENGNFSNGGFVGSTYQQGNIWTTDTYLESKSFSSSGEEYNAAYGISFDSDSISKRGNYLNIGLPIRCIGN